MTQYVPGKKEELVAKEIVDAAYRVHKNPGPGLHAKICNIPIKRALTES